MILRCYSETKEKICLSFYPLLENEYREEKYKLRDSLCLIIYDTDYSELLLEYLKKVYPFQNPITEELETKFDECFENLIDKKNWELILNHIKQGMVINKPFKKEIGFYLKFIEWIEDKLLTADFILVEGNL